MVQHVLLSWCLRLQRENRSVTNWKVGDLIPGSFSLHAEVSLGKMLNPTWLKMFSLERECVCVAMLARKHLDV